VVFDGDVARLAELSREVGIQRFRDVPAALDVAELAGFLSNRGRQLSQHCPQDACVDVSEESHGPTVSG